MIAIIDYDIGNIGAVVNMLQRLSLPCKVATNAADVEMAERIILPGNGAFDACMQNLRGSGLLPVLEKQVLTRGIPLLGICVGAQMLGGGSAEGSEAGLGWLDMQVERFHELPDLRVPHMGWNKVTAAKMNHLLTKDMTDDSRFYFVHSYYMMPKYQDQILLHANYGKDFAAAVVKGNIAGVQFHPEKSHRFGKQLLKAFSSWKP